MSGDNSCAMADWRVYDQMCIVDDTRRFWLLFYFIMGFVFPPLWGLTIYYRFFYGAERIREEAIKKLNQWMRYLIVDSQRKGKLLWINNGWCNLMSSGMMEVRLLFRMR